GAALAPILANLHALEAAGAAIWLRSPLIPGLNDDEAALHALGAFVRDLRTRRIHLLPFHRLGADKHRRLGREDPMAGLRSPDAATIERATGLLQSYGLDVHLGG
ncbi:MAG TPA: hypothetical protein VJZ50_07140, partial [Candidatus Limnocylindrales bacterium]|nr:hypothetical protein [Candidatus Limnocylindrales bacterium]